MGVKFNMKADDFFQKVLPADVYEVSQSLAAQGVETEISFYGVSMTYNGKVVKTTVPISTSSIMKGTGTDDALAISVKNLTKLVVDAGKVFFLNGTPSDGAVKVGKAKPQVPTASADTVQSIANVLDKKKPPVGVPIDEDTQLKNDMASLIADQIPAPSKPKVNLKEVVPLVTASEIGQMTRGTSPSSIYRAVAISNRLNVAARIEGPNVSLRAEGKPNAFEKGKLKALGFSEKPIVTGGSYWSVHMDTAALTPARVVGAVLMDLGIQFEQQAKNLKEVSLES